MPKRVDDGAIRLPGVELETYVTCKNDISPRRGDMLGQIKAECRRRLLKATPLAPRRRFDGRTPLALQQSVWLGLPSGNRGDACWPSHFFKYPKLGFKHL